MPKQSKTHGSKGKGPSTPVRSMSLSDVSEQLLVSLFGEVASTVRVPLLPVVILADEHGGEHYLGSFIPEM